MDMSQAVTVDSISDSVSEIHGFTRSQQHICTYLVLNGLQQVLQHHSTFAVDYGMDVYAV